MTTPLYLAGRPIGVLHVANPARDFTVADVERAASLTPRVAAALELARTLFKLRRQGKLEEILSAVAVAVASGESVMDFLRPAIGEVGQAVEASFVAMVPDGGEPAIWRHGHSPLEEVVLEEVSRRPGMRAYVVGPEKAGDPGWAAFYAPVHLSGHRVGTLAAMRTRAEPFAREERQALVRLAGLGSLSFATERYKQQRAELARLQERQRIADDLHDDVAQILFAAQLNLDAILERKPATERGRGGDRTGARPAGPRRHHDPQGDPPALLLDLAGVRPAPRRGDRPDRAGVLGGDQPAARPGRGRSRQRPAPLRRRRPDQGRPRGDRQRRQTRRPLPDPGPARGHRPPPPAAHASTTTGSAAPATGAGRGTAWARSGAPSTSSAAACGSASPPGAAPRSPPRCRSPIGDPTGDSASSAAASGAVSFA